MAQHKQNYVIADLAPDDYAEWLPLWDGNNSGQHDPGVTGETWNRLTSAIFPIHGLSLRYEGRMVGLVHYVLHPVTGHIHPACYMQDLYVDPAFRRHGFGRAMVEYLAALGRREGWARLYWLAEADNEAAQALYKDLGIKLNFTFHVMPLKDL